MNVRRQQEEGIVGQWSVKMVVSRNHLALKAHMEIGTPGHWHKSTYHQAVCMRIKEAWM
jgi:hypothetical protein